MINNLTKIKADHDNKHEEYTSNNYYKRPISRF